MAAAATAVAANTDAKKKPKQPKKASPQWRLHTDEKTGSKYFKLGGKIMAGALNLTRQWYYPTWDFAQAKRAKPSAAEVADQKGTGPVSGTKAPSIAAAQDRGTRVDEILTRWVTYGDSGIDAKNSNKWSNALITFFKAQKWTPVKAQKIVGLAHYRVASAIDLLMRNEQKELILVEVKTTTGSYFTKSGGQVLSKPFEHVPSSAQTHAFLEAAFQKICWESERISREAIQHVYVVEARGDGSVDAAGPGEWFTELLADMKQRMTERGEAVRQRAKRKRSATATATAAATKKGKSTPTTATTKP